MINNTPFNEPHFVCVWSKRKIWSPENLYSYYSIIHRLFWDLPHNTVKSVFFVFVSTVVFSDVGLHTIYADVSAHECSVTVKLGSLFRFLYKFRYVNFSFYILYI